MGQIKKWSDIDLIVVKETDKPFMDRLKELFILLKPRVGLDVFVYTPKEFENIKKDNFLSKKLLKKGKFYMKEDEMWHTFALEGLQMAKLAIKDAIFNQVCFHSQQAVEKSIKALFESKKRIPPKTHKLADLLSFLKDSDIEVMREEIILLDRFSTRYPDALAGNLPQGLPSKKDAEEALDIAHKVLNIIKNKLAL